MPSTLFTERVNSGSLDGYLALTCTVMWRIETRRELGDAEFKAVRVLVESAHYHDGFPPLSDHLLLALERRGGAGFAAVLAFDESERLCGYAQLARANNSTVIELVVAPGGRDRLESLTESLLRSALEIVAFDGGGRVNWWVHRPGDGVEAIAGAVGLKLGRRLLQMRRTLPISETTTIDTRPFVVGQDEQEWLRVNNAAFHDHPEQGGWTLDALQQREAEPWFDPAGFRLYERDGKLAGFCWTKVHEDASPPMGEIYVIAVDPPYHGLGLGKALTISGLDHLGRRGVTIGMLHVDGANSAASSMYERLGFTVHHADHAYVADVSTAKAPT
jgi:mycothiol synthase